MDFEELVNSRRSVRGFKAEPVPRAVIEDIIVLAAWDRGLGSVINGQGIMRSDIVREVADIPQDQAIMTCVAMGYPDDSFAANGVKSDREKNNDFVRYVGFGD